MFVVKILFYVEKVKADDRKKAYIFSSIVKEVCHATLRRRRKTTKKRKGST